MLILLDVVPAWWQWMSDVSVFRYFLELSLAAQWGSYGAIPCDYFTVNGARKEICPFPNGPAVLDFYGMGRPAWVSVLVIAGWWALFKGLGYRALLLKCSPPASAFGTGPPPDDATAETMPASDQPNALLDQPNGHSAAGKAPAAGGSSISEVERRATTPMALAWSDFGLEVTLNPKKEGAWLSWPVYIFCGWVLGCGVTKMRLCVCVVDFANPFVALFWGFLGRWTLSLWTGPPPPSRSWPA